METFMEKMKCETKGKYISRLRESIPTLQGSSGRFIHIDRIPRVYPIAEFRRTSDDGRKFKSYNGVVQVEVNGLSGITEAEYVKSQAALLPQTPDISGSERSGRSRRTGSDIRWQGCGNAFSADTPPQGLLPRLLPDYFSP